MDRLTCLGTTGVPLTPDTGTMKKILPPTPTTAATVSSCGDTSNEAIKRQCVVLDESSMHKLSDHLIDDFSEDDECGDFCDFGDDDNVTRSSSEDEDDDSTIDGTNWGLTESDDDEDDLNSTNVEMLGASAARLSVYSSSNDSSQFSFDYDDDGYSGEYEEDIDEDRYQSKRIIDPKSRFFAVPAKRMSMGEMETVVDTVFRSFNSLSESLHKKPSERRLSFAAAMVEKQIFDKSAPACATARGCLTRMEKWANPTQEGSGTEISDDENLVAVGSAAPAPTPKKLKSILKIFPRFSKPRPTFVKYQSERLLTKIKSIKRNPSHFTTGGCPPRRDSSFFNKQLPKDVDKVSPRLPRRQHSLLRPFSATPASPPQPPRRRLSARLQNVSRDGPASPPSRKLSRQGSSFMQEPLS